MELKPRETGVEPMELIGIGPLAYLALGIGVGAVACLIGMFVYVVLTPRF